MGHKGMLEAMVPEFTHGTGPYALVLAWLWIASLGVPMPEDIALLTGGFFCYRGDAKVWLMILVSMFGVLSGDLFIFYLGHKWANNLFEHRLVRMIAKPGRIEKIKKRFLNHQIKTVFVGRFLPGMRALVFLTAGTAHMKLWKFLAVDGFAAIISVPVFIMVGYFFGQSFDRLKENITQIKHIITVVVVAGVAVWLIWLVSSKWAKARERRFLEAEEPPKPIPPPDTHQVPIEPPIERVVIEIDLREPVEKP